jgi:hypothetical protein
VIPGQLEVRIFAHVIPAREGPVPCWTFVSDGLLTQGQEEIAFTIKREPGEADADYPRTVLDLYRSIHAAAKQKRLVTEGGTTKLTGSAPLVRDDLRGIVYTAWQPFTGVEAPKRALTGILVTEPELQVVERYGELRFMALLGQRYHFFPTTPWLDRKRTEITRPDAMTGTLLARFTPLRAPGTWVRRDGPPGAPGGPESKVVLTLTDEAARQILPMLDKAGGEIAITLVVDLDPEADALLVWDPKSTGPAAISMPGAKGVHVAGNFLVLAAGPGVPADMARIAEDGFGVTLSPASWAQVRAGLDARKPVDIASAGGGMGFSLRWASPGLSTSRARAYERVAK